MVASASSLAMLGPTSAPSLTVASLVGVWSLLIVEVLVVDGLVHGLHELVGTLELRLG
jgi:hypothetical protein